MENATKALLIAAAVLIAIVIIALGVRLLGSANDSAAQADNVSGQLNDTTSAKVTELTTDLSSLTSPNN